MKKNVLALSITAALVGFGFAGSAQAIGLANGVLPAGTADRFILSSDGVGQYLVVPYYNAQGANNTMVNIVNTDTINGKAVKVRFRAAANSDDVFDFQVFLSPADVFTGAVSKGADGKVKFTTTDISCTKPDKAVLNATPFSTVRVDPNRTGDALLNETREGYVEIFNMADIPPNPARNPAAAVTNALYTAIKHVSGTPNTAPPCRTTPTNAAWVALDTDPVDVDTAVTGAKAKGLYEPTNGLFSNWIILNSTDAGAWSGAAPALYSVIDTVNGPVQEPGAIVYFPQTDAPLVIGGGGALTDFTADPWLRVHPERLAAYDLPDFSTPYTSAAGAATQASLLSQALATTKVMNEYLTPSAISANTDWVLSMPTRRYSVAYDYLATTAALGRVYTTLSPAYFTSANTTVIDRQVCVTNVAASTAMNINPWDQEETTPSTPGAGVIVSPQQPGVVTAFNICGEASVLAFNTGEKPASSGLITTASGALKATVARSAIDVPYTAGWALLTTPGLGNGLPVIGYEAVKAMGNAAQAFGATLPHRTDRVQK